LLIKLEKRCKEAIGIHWGTWSLTTEPISEPPRRLAEARKEVGLEEKQFYTVAIGETRMFEV
jgi:N-acyl-phosphatidylethanolamine-hydrolysing phospholipase D